MAEGLPVAEFWDSTPRMVETVLRGRRRAADVARDDRLELAWTIEALARAKKLPALRKLLAKSQAIHSPDNPQKPSEMLATLRAIRDAGAAMTIRKVEKGGVRG